MDVALIITAVISVFFVIALYILNKVQRIEDLDALYLDILKSKSDAKAFCLGRTSTGTYRNAVVDNDGKVVVRENDTYPINLDGAYIILKDHGTVSELPNGNGFKISGIDLVDFECPAGFEGINCSLKAICGPNDSGVLKPLTYTQFNELGLYSNASAETQLQSLDLARAAAEPTHPRIRVLCTNALGDYELQTCPNNTLLDSNLQCAPYDICEDRINGYKHNFQISTSEPALGKNEYYICNRNVSVRTTCADDTVYSAANFGCVSESLCYNRGDDTIAVDESSYIQCGNDRGRKITCPDGVVTDSETGILSCFVDTCVPETADFEDGMLSYRQGNTICTNGVADIKMCNTTPNPRVYNYKWFNSFTYSIDNWPSEIMDENRNCVPPTDAIVVNPIVQLQWTDAMPEPHDYNILTEKYVCPADTAYTLDYITQTVSPATDNIISHLAPCQNTIYDNADFDFTLFSPTDSSTLSAFMYYNCYLPNSSGRFYFWPAKQGDKYASTKVQIIGKQLMMTTSVSAVMPLGFAEPSAGSSDAARLVYIGCESFEPWATAVYLFFISGTLEPPVLYQPTVVDTLTYPILTSVDTSHASMFAIDMRAITQACNILPNVTFYPSSFVISSSVHTAGYVAMVIDVTSSNDATLQIGDLSPIQFSPQRYPTFEFS